MKINQIRGRISVNGFEGSKRKYINLVGKLYDTWKVAESICDSPSLWKPSFFLDSISYRSYLVGIELNYDIPCEFESSIKDMAIAKKMMIHYSDNSLPSLNLSHSKAQVVDFGDFNGEWKFDGLGLVRGESLIDKDLELGKIVAKATIQRNYKDENEAREHIRSFADKVSYSPVDTLFERYGQVVVDKSPSVSYVKILDSLDKESLDTFFNTSTESNQIVFVRSSYWDASPSIVKPEFTIYVPFKVDDNTRIAYHEWEGNTNQDVMIDLNEGK
jgi:hypothetical protein